MRYPFRSPFLTLVAGTITNAWTTMSSCASRSAGPLERQLVRPGPVGRRPAELAGALLHGDPVVGLERVLARRSRGIEDHRLARHDHDRGVPVGGAFSVKDERERRRLRIEPLVRRCGHADQEGSRHDQHGSTGRSLAVCRRRVLAAVDTVDIGHALQRAILFPRGEVDEVDRQRLLEGDATVRRRSASLR